MRTPPFAYFLRFGMFIQKTSAALPPLREVCSLVQYCSHGVSWMFTVMFGFSSWNFLVICCIAASCGFSQIANEIVTGPLSLLAGPLPPVEASDPPQAAAARARQAVVATTATRRSHGRRRPAWTEKKVMVE